MTAPHDGSVPDSGSMDAAPMDAAPPDPARAALERMRTRLIAGAALFALGFAGIGVRLVDVTLLRAGPEEVLPRAAAAGPQRADIVDRNGALLAATVPAHALYADTRRVGDPEGVALRLAALLPGIDLGATARKLASGKSFVWIRRALTPRQVHAVNRLGEPGLAFLPAERRLYPPSGLAAHVVGFTGVDHRGLAGIEARFDERLRTAPTAPLALSLDLRFQHVVREELENAMTRFSATGAAAVVLDAGSAEVLALVSLPAFDPHDSRTAAGDTARFNRATLGIFEPGSSFKAFTVAMALDSRTITLADGYDATRPLRVARFTIRDYHPQKRWLSVPEIFVHSSNIGAAKMALALGADAQRAFLGRLGLLAPLPLELPETGTPLAPARWREVNVATIAFGHGLAVSPLHLAAGIAALVNGGVWRPPTLLVRNGAAAPGRRVIAERTSRQMRQLFRLAVTRGTGGKADAEGWRVGGKTGTAEKLTDGRYDRDRLVSSFVAAFPMDAPRFVVLAMLDEPKGIAETRGYATGGWTAAPTVGRIVERVAPLAGLAPRFPVDPDEPARPDDGPAFDVSPDGSELRLASY